ncbi:helix-turn-helix transcriptional regulator [Olsenella sp. HMSC062G07]|uniref:helix-turn-helix domain-containing protein n=1 Tax=Olsenella sp. HMSC062G07 TaxID=1739330 RepID=UPI0008A291D3|nr:helix-turn-helix transcriptional regulator [Olsenella sp. HMSC062G07]OFK23654.1 hypothetical protein HMPREF2826_03920 [Olsenella sp. HMSC062G07]
MAIEAWEWEAINRITTLIYTSSTYPDLLEITRELRRLVPYSHSIACLVSNRDERVGFFHYSSDDIPAEQLRAYQEKYVYYDFILWYCAAPEPHVFRESDIIAEKYMLDSVFFKEWFAPLGIRYGAGIDIAGGGHAYGNICLYRSEAEGDFTEHDMLILSTVNQHLCIYFCNRYPNGLREEGSFAQENLLAGVYHLTPREMELARLVHTGVSRRALAEAAYLSESTVKKHLNSIYRKTGTAGYDELIRLVSPEVMLPMSMPWRGVD